MNANGIGVISHVMGDGSAREVVDIFEAVSAKNGNNDAILHLSHALMIQPEDLQRLSRLEGVAVDFSPALAVRVDALATLFKNPISEERRQSV